MKLAAIYANLSCSNLDTSTKWFALLFERDPDARPMRGLVEWHHQGNAGFQLFEKEQDAGRGTMTLIVENIQAEHARLREAAIKPGDIEKADYTTIFRLRDPDGNLVVLAQPTGA